MTLLQPLSKLQHLTHLELRCWPSETPACLNHLKNIPCLTYLSISSPCRIRESQLAFHGLDYSLGQQPCNHSQGSKQLLDNRGGSCQSSFLEPQGPVSCEVRPQCISLVGFLQSMPGLKVLQMDKHMAGLLLHTNNFDFLFAELDGSSRMKINVSGLGSLADSLHETLHGDLEAINIHLVRALLDPARLLNICWTLIGRPEPQAGEFVFELWRYLSIPSTEVTFIESAGGIIGSPYDTHEIRATNLTELSIVGFPMRHLILLISARLQQLRVLSLSVTLAEDHEGCDGLKVLRLLSSLSHLCLELTHPPHPPLLWTTMERLLASFQRRQRSRLDRLWVIAELMPRSFAVAAAAAAEEVFLSTDVHAWTSASNFSQHPSKLSPQAANCSQQAPDAGSTSRGSECMEGISERSHRGYCRSLDLPWAPHGGELVRGASLSDVIQLQHVGFPLAPSSSFHLSEQQQIIHWGAHCLSTLVSLRLDVRPMGGLQVGL